MLGILFYRIFTQGIGYLNADFLQNFASRKPEDAGIKAAFVGTIWLMAVVAPVSIISWCRNGDLFRGICERKIGLHDFIQIEYF